MNQNTGTVDVLFGRGFIKCKWSIVLHASRITSLGKPLYGDFWPNEEVTEGDPIYSNRNILLSLLYGAGVTQTGGERLPPADDKNLPWLYHGMEWYKGCEWYDDLECHPMHIWYDAERWYKRAERDSKRAKEEEYKRPVVRLGDYSEREIPSYDLGYSYEFGLKNFLKLKVEDVEVDPYDVDDGADYEKGSYYKTLKSAVQHVRAYFKEDAQRLPRDQLEAELKGTGISTLERHHLLDPYNPYTVYVDFGDSGLPNRVVWHYPKAPTEKQLEKAAAEEAREDHCDDVFAHLSHDWTPISELTDGKTNARRQLREALVARGAVAERVLIGKTRIWCVKLP